MNHKLLRMKNFIFFTKDGFTFDTSGSEVHNLQILGDATGENILKAFKNLKKNHTYLQHSAFKEVMALEYVGEVIYDLELN